MEFTVSKKFSKTKKNYTPDNLDLAYRFTKEIHEELKDLLKAVVLFGSAAKKKENVNDIDILLIVDDISIQLTKELVQAYRLIVEKTVRKVNPSIHVTSIKFTTFWENVRNGDPIALNILRDGFALIDTGFFEPIQLLLHQGRLKPSPETLWAYMNRSPMHLQNSRFRLKEAVVDLYWAVIDSAHAALMSINEVPPSPEHVAVLLEQKLVNKKLLNKKHPWTMRKFYDLNKKVTSGQIKDVTGKQYEEYYQEASEFVKAMKDFIEK